MVKKQVNQANDASTSKNNSFSKEQILNVMHQMYVSAEDGLISIGTKLGLHLFAPRRKVNILLIGNHSSGKSSFINWYVDSKIQKTGVAIETQGFTLVTNGKNRETLTGKATLHIYPYLKPLESIRGVLPYLTTELTPSQSRRFNLITFIDTPGLADGELHYPYDIERAILWLGDKADLIFVFFDPIGQALCKRTLNLVEKLMHVYSSRMRFFLTKADEAGEESDRQKVMMQIVQELCKRPGLNQSGFEMSTIYIPGHIDLKIRDQMCVNQIENTCAEIEKTIALTIQNTFNTMEKDIKQLEELAHTQLTSYETNMYHNVKTVGKALVLLLFCLQIPLAAYLYQNGSSHPRRLDEEFYDNYYFTSKSTSYQFNDVVAMLYRFILLYLYIIGRGLVFFFKIDDMFFSSIILTVPFFAVTAYFQIQFKPTRSLSQVNEIKRIISKLKTHRDRRNYLFSSYLTQMLSQQDL